MYAYIQTHTFTHTFAHLHTLGHTWHAHTHTSTHTHTHTHTHTKNKHTQTHTQVLKNEAFKAEVLGRTPMRRVGDVREVNNNSRENKNSPDLYASHHCVNS